MTSWRDLAKRILTPAEQKRMRASYDTIGDIAIVEIAIGLEKKEKRLAALLLKSQPNIKVVAKKVGSRKGAFRGQRLKVIAGENRFITTHVESGCQMMLDMRTCYFSPRMGTERLRISRQVGKRERILVLFGGIAPFALVIARQALDAGKPVHVDTVDLNKSAHRYAVSNVAINRLGHLITPIHADARKFLAAAANAKLTYDRILLAWPGRAEPFVGPALKILKKGGTLHFYDFQYEQSLDLSAEKVRAACKKSRRRCVIKNIAICGQKAPHVVRVCVDAIVK